MRSLLVAGLLLLPMSASAFIAVQTDQSQPYETVPVEATPGEARSFLGELTGYPIMYEVVSEEPFTFTAQVRQLGNRTQQPFSLILIRQNDRGGGVQEVVRMNGVDSEWSRSRDNLIGLSFSQSSVISEDVEPGTYRIEISTPENSGRFMLQIGDQDAGTGYWDQLSAVRTTQQWFGYGLFGMLGSSLVYQPLAILLLLFMIYKTWQYRDQLKLVKDNGPTA